jgi:hypothetical protein
MKYKAVFKTTAEVVIELEVEAENQQEGLVNAHDLILMAKPEQAKIVSLHLDKAINTAFTRVEQANAGAAETVQQSVQRTKEGFLVQFFADRDQTREPVREIALGSYEAAKQLAETTVLGELSPYGSARVLGEYNTSLLKVNALRGGWEVEMLDAEGKVVQRSSWLGKEEAKELAFDWLKRCAAVRIYDYTDRKLGSVLWRELR